MTQQLVKLGIARQAIAEAKSVDELRFIRDKAEAIRYAAKQAGMSAEIINDAAEMKLRAERRGGELLAGMEKRNGARGTGSNQHKRVELQGETPPTLEDVGVTKNESYRWQLEASVPEADFEQHIVETRERGGELSTAGVMRMAKKQSKRDNPAAFDAKAYNIWNYGERNPAFGNEYPGNIPGEIIQNLLWFYTNENDLVLDPFAGGGVTLDVCRWWTDNLWPVSCLAMDAQPSRDDIVANDITTGLPKYVNGLASLAFLDPPYWKQKRGDYIGGNNLADMDLDGFHSALEAVVNVCLKTMSKCGHVALLIGATQQEGEFIDHARELMARIANPIVQRIIVPYSTQQYAAYDVSRVKENKQMLNLYRDLIIWGKE